MGATPRPARCSVPASTAVPTAGTSASSRSGTAISSGSCAPPARRKWLTDGTADYARLRSDPAAPAELGRRLVDLLAGRTAVEWEALGRDAGVPLAAVRTAPEWQEEAPRLVPEPVRVEADGVRRAPVVSVHDRGAVVRRPRRAADGDGPLTGSASSTCSGARRADGGPAAGRAGAEVTKVDVDRGRRGPGCASRFHERQPRETNGGRGSAHAGGAERCASCAVTPTCWSPTLPSRASPARPGPRHHRSHRAAPGARLRERIRTSGPWADLRGYAEIRHRHRHHRAYPRGRPPSGVAPNVDLPRSPTTDYAAGILGAFAALLAPSAASGSAGRPPPRPPSSTRRARTARPAAWLGRPA